MDQQQQSQLKDLITKGKEQGFLTYAQVNDHLPDDIVDPEQIEDIINMINDMGIQVHEQAPDADTLILNDDATTDTDEDDAEEAAAALAAVETEIGRTTDPVRMYMREMGTVELLTREGEIAIAKRIEEGLFQVHSALARFPGCIEALLGEFEQYREGKLRLAELIVDFIDPETVLDDQPVIPAPKKPAKATAQKASNDSDDDEDDDDDDSDSDEDTGQTGPDPEEVERRMGELSKMYDRFLKLHEKHGPEDPKVLKIREQMAAEFMHYKLPPRMVDYLIDRLRFTVSRTRDLERMIMQMAVVHSRMPKRTFLVSFAENEANPRWLTPLLRGKQKWVPALKEHAAEIRGVQAKLGQMQEESRITIAEL
ncbi:MAG: RNA polymerase sigma factor region1.1 domain-containing protein, partial [Xanthomonadales bacterium]|nr:RNA polymerase sigma factor region1.1 domain-containing protein [Xanthomonadales bacterium]